MKYGLSVTGLVGPRRLTANDTGKLGDKLILTKALGVGLICTANRVGEAAPVRWMLQCLHDDSEQVCRRDKPKL